MNASRMAYYVLKFVCRYRCEADQPKPIKLGQNMNTRSLLRRLFCGVLFSGLIFSRAISGPAQTSVNVTNYGAVGDAANILANTTINSATVTFPSGSFTSTDVGKVIELFGVGTSRSGTWNGTYYMGNEDLIAIIANVVNATNVILNIPAGATSNGVYCVYGTQNVPAFQSAIDAAGTNTIIIIPAGNYLLVPPQQLGAAWNSWYISSLVIAKGGIHFIGEDKTNTILTGCGAWKQYAGPACWRGLLFALQGPVTNNYPLIFENLTMDGGVQIGNTGIGGTLGNPYDGSGWDGTHSAVEDVGYYPRHDYKAFINCEFTHWRGEEVKSVMIATNGFILMTNCVFNDGNATGFNFSSPHTIDHCVFINLKEAEEFYVAFCTGSSYFQNNLVTNMTGGFFALNGATGTNPSYYITNNIFDNSTEYSAAPIMTAPAVNAFILNNTINLPKYGAAIAIGVQGYQGSFCNSNIVVSGNHVVGQSNPGQGQFLLYGNDPPNNVVNLTITNNTVTNVYYGLQSGGLAANVRVAFNTFLSPVHFLTGTRWSGTPAGPFILIETNNNFAYSTSYSSGAVQTNVISYKNGPKVFYDYTPPADVFVLEDSTSNQIPAGAYFSMDNRSNRYATVYNGYSAPVTIYPSQNSYANPTVLKLGQMTNFYWSGSVWTLKKIIPPLGLRVSY
jgi:hypothetical protein